MAQLEEGDNGNEHCNLRSTGTNQRSEKNVESVVEAFGKPSQPLNVEDQEGMYCTSSGLCVTRYARRSFKSREIWQRNER